MASLLPTIRRRGAAILFVVGVQQENQVQSPDQFRIRFEFAVGQAEHHVKQVFGESFVRVRVHEKMSQCMPVGICGYSAHLGHDASGGFLKCILVLNLQQLGIETADDVEYGREYSHGRGVGREEVEVAPNFFAQHLVPGERIAEAFKLPASGQLTPDEKVSSLEKATMFGQFLDGNSAVAQNALFSIDIGDGTLARSSVAESIIQSNETTLSSQSANIDGAFGFAADHYGQVYLFLA